MNKLFLSFVALLILAFSFVSCENNDDENASSGIDSIIGDWVYIGEYFEDGSYHEATDCEENKILIFREDGVLLRNTTEVVNNTCVIEDTVEISWYYLPGEEVYAIYDDSVIDPYTDYWKIEFEQDKMTVKGVNGDIFYEKR